MIITINIFRCHASFNELLSTTPEEWEDKYADVNDFVNAVNNLKSDAFKKAFKTTLLNPPTTLTCQKLYKTEKETFGGINYKIDNKIFDTKV